MFDLLTSLLARARSLFYDNSDSGLTADNVQDAIDEIASSGAGQPFTALSDPALNSIDAAMIDTKGGVVITLSAPGNDQTLPTPTDTSIAHKFTVINNDTSTDNIDIIGAITVTLQPGEKSEFVYDGTAWIASEAEGIWLDDGTDVKLQNSTRNIDSQTGKFKSGSNTELSESSGDSLRENTSATNDIIDKLGDAAGVTSKKTVDSSDATLHQINSDGSVQAGKAGVDGTAEVRDASNDVKVKLNSNGDSYFVGGKVGIGDVSPVGKLAISGDATNQAVLRVGQANNINAGVVVITSDNVGTTGQALFVRQKGTGDIVQFYDDASPVMVIRDGGNIGINTGTPTARLDINGSMNWKVRTIAASTGTIAITDNVVVVDYTTTGTVALDLPSAATAWNTDGTGMVFTFIDKDANAGTNNITISRAGADTIITTTTGNTSFLLATDGAVKHLVAIDATTWKVF